MARRPQRVIVRLGAICMGVLLLAMFASFNLQHFPGFRGTGYHAEFSDASGLKVGDIVEVAGIRVGRVDAMNISGTHIVVDFDVHGAEFGRATTASIEVLNLLGEKYLLLTPKGTDTMRGGATIPLAHTTAAYDIVGALSDLTTTTENINQDNLTKALSTLGDTLNSASPEIAGTFSGLARLSQTIASRDTEISDLLTRAQNVTQVLNARKDDLIGLMQSGDQVFQMLIQRRDAIKGLLDGANRLATQLKGIATDNQAQIGPALAELNKALTFLNARKDELNDTIKYYGPYASILENVIGTGPWFDAYVPNLPGLTTGEFVSGTRKY